MTIPFEFILFGATLLGIALFHRHTLPIALGGLAAITAYKQAIEHTDDPTVKADLRNALKALRSAPQGTGG